MPRKKATPGAIACLPDQQFEQVIVVPRSDKRFRIVDAAQQSGRLVQAASR